MIKKIKNNLSKLHPSIHVALAVILFFIAVVASRGSALFAWEESLYLSIYNLPGFLTPFVLFMTSFGSIQVLAILVLIFAFKKKYNELIRLLLASILAYQLAGFAKDIWGRTRPNELLLDIVARDYYRGPGFPSGHVALAVAMAFVVGHYLPKKYHWVVAAWVVGVGFSRIYLGVHAPLDVVGGFAIGWFSYMLFRHVRLYPIRFGHRKNRATKKAYTKPNGKSTKKAKSSRKRS